MRRADPRPPVPEQRRRYGSLASFYTADSRRIHSRELDVGLWWREEPHDPLHRAAWIKDTGELYLVRLGPEADGGGRVEVLATVAERERMEALLQGWRERCGEPRSLSWLRRRVARGSAAARARMTRQPVLYAPGHLA
ncbi:MAG TPA: hypothetical protein VFY36_10200 [Solirubrobacteraceae bacterium]|nr:hypothetical protein [Solirubrobacteraceae bacterium]